MDNIVPFMCDMALIYMFLVSLSEKPVLGKTYPKQKWNVNSHSILT